MRAPKRPRPRSAAATIATLEDDLRQATARLAALEAQIAELNPAPLRELGSVLEKVARGGGRVTVTIGWEGRRALEARTNAQHAAHRALVVAWRCALEATGRRTMSARQALALRDPGPLLELRAVIERIAHSDGVNLGTRWLGYLLRSLREKAFETEHGALALVSGATDRNGAALWHVVALDRARRT